MTTIQIELLKAPTIIHRTGGDFGPFGAFAEVQDVQFDGESYSVTARFIEGDDDHVGETEVEFIVGAGECITFGGRGEPKLRADADVTAEEWAAKVEAIDADCLILQGRVNGNQGHVCQPIDEAPLVAAVAEAIAVPALMAAE